MNTEIPVKAIQEQMQKKFHVVVSKTKAFRAKAKAQVHLKGDVKVQYSLLRDYVSELQKCNPDTIVKIDVYREEDLEKTTRMFRRIYVCLGALKRGWKGIAWFGWGIYERSISWKNANSYLFSNSNLTFIIDRQKGLLPIIARLFPSVEHRYCVSHINENMNLTWKEGDYKEMLWKAKPLAEKRSCLSPSQSTAANLSQPNQIPLLDTIFGIGWLLWYQGFRAEGQLIGLV
ncbi:hypothetical protein Tco_0978168 [Tanacetum coccineum]|uniref:MULE transposase domain-containing protein n=1 Tax=Tanacetum coccineum TaxID=301880 RepID=A0ABQ5EM41_9ASTR